MTKTPEQKMQMGSVKIDLPRNTYSALSHLDNIKYCINKIRRYSKEINEPVVGYVLERGWGIQEAHHRILSKKHADNLKGNNPRFDYFTLDVLLKEKADIEDGRYVMSGGLIIDFSPSYIR